MKVDLRPWLQARLGTRIEKHGDEWAIPCPECDVGRVKEFRLWFNVSKNAGTCYKCHRGFNVTSLVQTLEGVSMAEALRLVKEHTVGGVLSLLALKQRVEQAFSETGERAVAPLEPMDLPDEFVSAASVPEFKWPAYLMERVRSAKTILNYGIGWCRTGYFRKRMVVPVEMNGVTVAFVARDMTGKAERKVLYPKGCHTSRMLFNYDRAKSFAQVVLVESVLDALRVGPRAMAIFGTSFSNVQAQLLAASSAREVVVMFDGDTAGEEGAEKVVERLRATFKIRVVRLPSGKDPDDFTRASLRVMVKRAPYVGRGDLAAHVRRALAR